MVDALLRQTGGIDMQLGCIIFSCTREQENFTTGNFRDFRHQVIHVQEIFENVLIAEVLGFPTVASD